MPIVAREEQTNFAIGVINISMRGEEYELWLATHSKSKSNLLIHVA